ncbi:MAG: glutathione transferase GstA [Deltaproteobacteria bacterium]|nr:glutathione transferase GstA [Deltaproteobacteria bacterium]
MPSGLCRSSPTDARSLQRRIDGKTHKTESGADYYAVNPKGQVPALQLEDAQVLTEGAVIVQYLADLKPEAKLAPANGTWERYRLQEWLNFVATELHKGFSPLFNPKFTGELRQAAMDRLAQRLDHVEAALSKSPFLMGQGFSVADAYLFTILTWSKRGELDLSRWPAITAFVASMRARPSVQAAMKAEGLS